MINKKLPCECPACDHLLKVKSLHCENCNTTIDGMFELSLQARMSKQDQEFILNFVKFSGSLKQMAKHLELSYPTVRNMLNDLIERLNQLES